MLKKRKSVKPKIHTVSDAYADYAIQLLRSNEDLWGKRDVNIRNYHIYKKSGSSVIEITSYPRYKRIVETFMKQMGIKLVEGGTMNLLNNNGYLKIKKIDRSFRTPKINWGESNKRKKEIVEREGLPLQGNNGGEKWLVYYTDDSYFRLGWAKPRKGGWYTKFYKFLPARGRHDNKGFKEQMSTLIRERPELRSRYQHFNVKREKVP